MVRIVIARTLNLELAMTSLYEKRIVCFVVHVTHPFKCDLWHILSLFPAYNGNRNHLRLQFRCMNAKYSVNVWRVSCVVWNCAVFFRSGKCRRSLEQSSRFPTPRGRSGHGEGETPAYDVKAKGYTDSEPRHWVASYLSVHLLLLYGFGFCCYFSSSEASC